MGAISLGIGIGVGKMGRKGIITAAQIRALFTYQIDWENDTQLPNLGTLMSNNNDGRLFREQSNVAATMCPRADGVLVSIPSTRPRFTTAGLYTYPGATMHLIQNRTLTNAAWVSDGITAVKNATGPDGVANSAWTLTATKANATLKQTITAASATRMFQIDAKAGNTGNFEMAVDGTTYTAKVAPANWDTFNPALIQQAAVTNPVVSIRLANSGDSIIVDFPMCWILPANFDNIPCMHRITTTTASLLAGQCRQASLSTDLSPFYALCRDRWSGYMEAGWDRPTGGFLLTGATNTFLSVNAGGFIRLAIGTGQADAPVGAHTTGRRTRNKIAWTSRNDGSLDIAVNGQLGTTGNGNPDPALDHIDNITNGAGNNNVAGYQYKFMAMAAALSRTQLAILTA